MTREPPTETPPAMAGRRFGKRRLEPIAIGVMGLGFVMMFQPFAQLLYTYSFIVILLGTVMFVVVSHLPE